MEYTAVAVEPASTAPAGEPRNLGTATLAAAIARIACVAPIGLFAWAA